jgi:hypothetical protein
MNGKKREERILSKSGERLFRVSAWNCAKRAVKYWTWASVALRRRDGRYLNYAHFAWFSELQECVIHSGIVATYLVGGPV